MANFIPIDNHNRLDELFKQSFERPVAIFKHSNSCGISAHILEMVNEVDRDVHIVVIQEHRDLSSEIATKTGHAHQSPQAFVVRDGKAIYHATHYGIDPVAIEKALNSE